jgi:hypothetical protein
VGQISSAPILGALLDAVVHGLKRLPEIRLGTLPRLADFALWATACEEAFCPAGTFLAAYSNNRATAVGSAIDADPVAAAVRRLMTLSPPPAAPSETSQQSSPSSGASVPGWYSLMSSNVGKETSKRPSWCVMASPGPSFAAGRGAYTIRFPSKFSRNARVPVRGRAAN